MKSMTGYGYLEEQNDKFNLSIEIKSYNNKYCDIVVNVPSYLSPLERKIREYLGPKLVRGRIELFLRYKELEENLSVELDKNAAKKYYDIFSELIDILGIDTKITLDHLLSVEGIVKIQKEQDIDRTWNNISPFFDKVFASYEETKNKEGEITRQDIMKCLDLIQKSTEAISKRAKELEQKIFDQLKEKFTLIVGEDFDQGRLLNETAVTIVKYSINEELIRLKAHLQSFRDYANSGAPVGKKLDFICQEINREINTIGSKSVILEINQAVIESKDALEKIREQLRNVE